MAAPQSAVKRSANRIFLQAAPQSGAVLFALISGLTRKRVIVFLYRQLVRQFIFCQLISDIFCNRFFVPSYKLENFESGTLLQKKIGRDENRVLFTPFGAESSNKVSGWSLPCPMAPSAHFAVWVSVWVKARMHRSAPLHETG